jgi:hypothetical protein
MSIPGRWGKLSYLATVPAHLRTDRYSADVAPTWSASASPPAPGHDPIVDAYDVIEWHRENLALVTNLPLRGLPVDAIDQHRLPAIPLLAPTAGLIAEFLRHWYGQDYRSRLHIVADVDSIYYGLALLRSRLVHGALIAASAAANAAADGRLPGGPDLRVIDLTTDYQPPLQLLAGIFARKGERARYVPDHPLNLLWNAFQTHSLTHAAGPKAKLK